MTDFKCYGEFIIFQDQVRTFQEKMNDNGPLFHGKDYQIPSKSVISFFLAFNKRKAIKTLRSHRESQRLFLSYTFYLL